MCLLLCLRKPYFLSAWCDFKIMASYFPILTFLLSIMDLKINEPINKQKKTYTKLTA